LVDRDSFDRRLARLEELIRDLRRLAAVDRETFLRDHDTQAKAERWLQLAGEAAIDLANHLIADHGWATPSSYREAFRVLARERALSEKLASEMEGWASLRNILVHLYLEVDHERLYEILTEEIDQLEEYARAMASAADA
jgi:uncharacterized protein YutE (UPF0331/DUF86 family)